MRRINKTLCLSGLFLFFIFAGFVQAQESKPEIKLPELPKESSKGKFEIDVHYSGWSLNLIKGWFENEANTSVAEEIRDQISLKVKKNHPFIFDKSIEQELVFDSEGHNLGLEIRFYPRGPDTPFSLGLSIEENVMRILIQGTMKQVFSNNTYAEGPIEATLVFKPILTNLSFRWDLVPQWIVSPYFVIGLGFGAMRGEIGYSYQSVYTTWSGAPEEYTDNVEETLKEAEEDIEYNLPNIFPLFQLGFGLRAQILPFLHLKGEVGFWNGFILRAGMAYRF